MHKIIQYRNKCIGCGVCYELQPVMWRMSKKDGKATLVNGKGKKDVFLLDIPASYLEKTRQIAAACPVSIIKVL